MRRKFAAAGAVVGNFSQVFLLRPAHLPLTDGFAPLWCFPLHLSPGLHIFVNLPLKVGLRHTSQSLSGGLQNISWPLGVWGWTREEQRCHSGLLAVLHLRQLGFEFYLV